MAQEISGATLLEVPSLIHYKERLTTFDDWPLTGKPSKTEMAKAGFFHVGFGDYTMCVFCHVKLHNWKPNDKPFEEHYRHSNGCAYLLLTYVPTDVESCPVTFTVNRSHNNGLPLPRENDYHSTFVPRKTPAFTTFGK